MFYGIPVGFFAFNEEGTLQKGNFNQLILKTRGEIKHGNEFRNYNNVRTFS